MPEGLRLEKVDYGYVRGGLQEFSLVLSDQSFQNQLKPSNTEEALSKIKLSELEKNILGTDKLTPKHLAQIKLLVAVGPAYQNQFLSAEQVVLAYIFARMGKGWRSEGAFSTRNRFDRLIKGMNHQPPSVKERSEASKESIITPPVKPAPAAVRTSTPVILNQPQLSMADRQESGQLPSSHRMRLFFEQFEILESVFRSIKQRGDSSSASRDFVDRLLDVETLLNKIRGKYQKNTYFQISKSDDRLGLRRLLQFLFEHTPQDSAEFLSLKKIVKSLRQQAKSEISTRTNGVELKPKEIARKEWRLPMHSIRDVYFLSLAARFLAGNSRFKKFRESHPEFDAEVKKVSLVLFHWHQQFQSTKILEMNTVRKEALEFLDRWLPEDRIRDRAILDRWALTVKPAVKTAKFWTLPSQPSNKDLGTLKMAARALKQSRNYSDLRVDIQTNKQIAQALNTIERWQKIVNKISQEPLSEAEIFQALDTLDRCLPDTHEAKAILSGWSMPDSEERKALLPSEPTHSLKPESIPIDPKLIRLSENIAEIASAYSQSPEPYRASALYHSLFIDAQQRDVDLTEDQFRQQIRGDKNLRLLLQQSNFEMPEGFASHWRSHLVQKGLLAGEAFSGEVKIHHEKPKVGK